jgi:hypothetical protein
VVDLPNTREITLTEAIDWLASGTAPSIAEKGDHDDYKHFVRRCRVYNEAMAAVIASDEERFAASFLVREKAPGEVDEHAAGAMRGDIAAFSKSAVRTALPELLAGTPQNVLNILADVTTLDDEWAGRISDCRKAARETIARREKEAEARESAWRRIMATDTALRPYRLGPRGEREKCDLLEIDPKLHRGDPYLEPSSLKPTPTDNVVIDRAIFLEWVDGPEAKESNGSTKIAAKRRGRRKGSGQTWDWSVIEEWIAREFADEGRLGAKFGWTQAILVGRIQQECIDKWGDHPSQSLLIEHIQKVEAGIKTWQTAGPDYN